MGGRMAGKMVFSMAFWVGTQRRGGGSGGAEMGDGRWEMGDGRWGRYAVEIGIDGLGDLLRIWV
jgi:hypothetical protein